MFETPHKRCRKCKILISISDFDKDRQQIDGLHIWCKTCKRKGSTYLTDTKRLKEWTNSQSKEKIAGLRDSAARRCHLRKYGLTVDDFDRMVEEQGGVCAICKKEDPIRRRLSIDYDHEKNIVRGLLCLLCNKGIGCFRDSQELLKEAIRYLNVPRIS